MPAARDRTGRGDLARLQTPWQLGGLELPHRVVLGSMHTGQETRDDGGAGLAAFYRERVEGGAALVITGGLAVDDVARGGPDYGVLTDQAMAQRLARVVTEVHQSGGRIVAQLFHAGRYALLDGLADAQGDPLQALAPSAVPWRAARGAVPREMTEEDIRSTIEHFAAAARCAQQVGVDAVEIMASEGYLLNQFTSPVTNLREDAWGGDAERRRRMPLAVLTAVRAAVDIPVMVRMSGADLMPGAPEPGEVDDLARAYAAVGADAISVGIGWHESPVPTVQASVPHAAWLPCAERVADAVHAERPGLPVVVSNRIIDLRHAETILQRGHVDAVALARPFLADSQIVARSLAGEYDLVTSCIGCDQACIDRSLVGKRVSCLVNPRAGYEAEMPLGAGGRAGQPPVPADRRRAVAVVGGGPAGLAASLDLVERGHRVTLFEAEAELGGQFRLAARVPGKEDYALAVHGMAERLHAAGAELRLGRRAGVDDLIAYDAVILATGVRPRSIDLPGSDLPGVLNYEQALTHGVPPGPVAIIGGGGIGVDVAATLVEAHDPTERAQEFADRFGVHRAAEDRRGGKGRKDALAAVRRPGEQVTVMRRGGRFATGVGITSRWVVLGALRQAGVSMLAEVQYEAVTPHGVEVVSADGDRLTVPATTVVVCAGQVSHDPLSAALRARGVSLEVVGGALDASGVDAVRATRQALRAARRLVPG